jgi:hypothetical protein
MGKVSNDMIKQLSGDIFKQEKVNMVVHCANCFHTMNSGIARQIREQFPEAYEADCKTNAGDRNKLGTYSFARIKNDKFPHLKYIVNLYGQFDFGGGGRFCSYDAIVKGLEKLRDDMLSSKKELTLGIPYKMASDRAGGDWNIVESIIHSVFEEYPIDVYICKYEP